MRYEIIKAALGEYGVIEQPGAVENTPRILEYFAEIGHSWVKEDETAWCSAFCNFIAKTTNHEYSGELNARSWLTVGIRTSKPEPGDVVVLWRSSKTSWKGHVGFFVRKDDSQIWILGGNQSNQVCIAPYDSDRLLDYRILNINSQKLN
jgi:uncharacterized protein (TIGR02594 family)